MAAFTAWIRCVKVAQPRPYKPGSEVITLTITRRECPGWVKIVLMSSIFTMDDISTAKVGHADVYGMTLARRLRLDRPVELVTVNSQAKVNHQKVFEQKLT